MSSLSKHQQNVSPLHCHNLHARVLVTKGGLQKLTFCEQLLTHWRRPATASLYSWLLSVEFELLSVLISVELKLLSELLSEEL